MQKILIGIDPDLLKSGFCCMIDGKLSELSTLSFFAMIEKIKTAADAANVTNGSIVVYIEAGWLNAKKNYHGAKNTSVAARIGANVGENHAVGKLLEQAMKFYAIPYQLIKPTTAKWDAHLFKQITGLNERTNQEERDALKLIWCR
jgi:hypothetical protein